MHTWTNIWCKPWLTMFRAEHKMIVKGCMRRRHRSLFLFAHSYTAKLFLLITSVLTGVIHAVEMPTFEKGTKRPTTMREVRDLHAKDGLEVFRPTIEPAKGVTIKKDIVYAERKEKTLHLDLFLPAPPAAEPHQGQAARLPPLVVLIHGGGWKKGDKSGEHSKAAWFANRGYAAASIQYRLSGDATFPAAIDDCKRAIAVLRHQASQHGYDPDRIAVMGFSAGAHLAALAATTGDNPIFETTLDIASNAVQAAVIVAGPTDCTNPNAIEDSRSPDGNYRLFLGASYDDNPTIFTKASPLTYVSENTPPCLFVGENSDKSSAAMRDRMTELNLPFDSLVLTGGVHGEWNWEPWFTITMEKSRAFLESHFKNQ
ncbi:MAG: alpha/beta hydrolase [Verrucomicrobiota bacterium]